MSLLVETPRLRIATLTPSDIAPLHELTSDAEVMKYFPKVLSYAETSEMLKTILLHYERYGYCFWKILSKLGEDFVGIAGILHQTIDGRDEAEVSYRIARRHWNNGYATEAATACMEYARTRLGKTRLISIIHPQNSPSLRVAQKLGARKEKTISFVGTTHDVYLY